MTFFFPLTRAPFAPPLPTSHHRPCSAPTQPPAPPATMPAIMPSPRPTPPSHRACAPYPPLHEPTSTLLCTNLLLPLPSASIPNSALSQPSSATDPLPCTRALAPTRLHPPLPEPDLHLSPLLCPS
ncbi:hypothetical protein SLEP1_g58936 [Rubroshorea leprosula]|uniref:Uncharacterized protein n=1 Tax=Rubroshorea leprosula TaxID=152421 RepID=A0AAV5MVF3_9ROSI|nr:hypothetical protein SLEP1_g58936 [Rubroshorea leprosula]